MSKRYRGFVSNTKFYSVKCLIFADQMNVKLYLTEVFNFFPLITKDVKKSFMFIGQMCFLFYQMPVYLLPILFPLGCFSYCFVEILHIFLM